MEIFNEKVILAVRIDDAGFLTFNLATSAVL